jgi:DNA-binding IclR family transcriptional regulator
LRIPGPRRDAGRAERQLLEAIERHGEITPARAALETALTVAEADRMLGELAQKGYLEVHAREGRIFYSL